VKNRLKLILAILIPIMSLIIGAFFLADYNAAINAGALSLGKEQIHVGAGATMVVSNSTINGSSNGSIYNEGHVEIQSGTVVGDIQNIGTLEIRGGVIRGDIYNSENISVFGGNIEGKVVNSKGTNLTLCGDFEGILNIELQNYKIGDVVCYIDGWEYDESKLNITNVP